MSLPISLKLPDNFLAPEVRCGFEVSEKLKKIWAVELDLLGELLRVCAKYDIKVQVFGGTLLGAVRQSGFIPWDDDVDVAMTREEFDKLVSVAQSEFKAPYFFQTALTDRRYFFAYARLRNSQTTAIIASNDAPEYNGGIYVDIYILEGYVDNPWLFRLQNVFLMLFVKPLTLYYQDVPRNATYRERLLRSLRPVVRCFQYETLYRCYLKVLCFFTRRANRIGLRDEMSENAKRYWMYKDECKQTTSLRFENLTVPAPANYSEILTRLYGQYMDFPSAAERGTWHEGQIHFDPDIPYAEYLKRRRG